MAGDLPDSQKSQRIVPPRRLAFGMVETVIALTVAAGHLMILRGVQMGTLLLFVVPPGLALMLQSAPQPHVRRMSLVFLLLVAIGAVVAPFPMLFPKLGGVDRRLPLEADRLLTWYAAAYIVFIFCVLPPWVFLRSLAQHRRGQPAPLSRPTCYLGLLVTASLWIGIPRLLGMLGMWPIV